MSRYIDADAAVKRFEELHGSENIETQPTADVQEVKRGHWIYPDDYQIACTCSCCGWNGLLYESDVGDMPYCPNCGAKMNGQEETQ